MALMSYASYRPEFTLSSISIVGASMVSAEDIHAFTEAALDDGKFHVLSPRNIFLYPRGDIERGIVQEFAPVRSARMTRPSPLSTSASISIEERSVFALWCQRVATGESSRCYQMDEGGFIFARSASFASSTTQYVFEGGLSHASSTDSSPIGATFAPTHLPGLVALLDRLGQAGYGPRGASVLSEKDFSVPVSQGFFIKAPFGSNPGALVHDLQLVLASGPLQGKISNLEYIDLRFGNRVYYKMKGSPESE